MFDVIEMPLHWPVDVNYHEAKAFCLWKGPEYRLPTEAEHHRMRGEDVRITIDNYWYRDFFSLVDEARGS